jgi:hypothetical protein
VQEHTLIQHVCEPKRRHQSAHDPHVKQAYHVYVQIWRELNPTRRHLTPTYQEFCVSHMWPTLVRFVSWCQEQLVQEFESFVCWLLKNNVRMVTWCDRHAYDEFLKDLLLTEPPEQALCRSLKLVHEWHVMSEKPYSEFFACVNVHQLTRWIQQGRMSAWLLYNCVTAEKYFVRCSPEQLDIIQQTAPITVWKVKFLRMATQVSGIKPTLNEAGM